MRKSDLIQEATSLLRDAGVRKPVRLAKHVLHVSDDDGNSEDFVIRQTDRNVQFTKKDVTVILDSLLQVMCDALKRGDKVSISGIGTIGLVYRKGSVTRIPDTGEIVDVPGRFSPKLTYGRKLKMCAKLYELSLSDHKEEEVIDDDDPTMWEDDE